MLVPDENTCEKGSNAFVGKVKRFLEKTEDHPLPLAVCASLLLTLVVEMLSRRSALDGLEFMIAHPVRFLMNMLIIMITLSASVLFRRRDFFFAVISAAWLTLGITNCVLLGYRTTPLGIVDFALLKSSVGIINVYVDLWQIILAGAIAAALITGLAMLFIKAHRHRVTYLNAFLLLLAVGAGLALTTAASVNAEDLEDSFSNIASAYEEYGFAYCFSTGVVDRGVDKPENYSKEAVDSITEKLSDGARSSSAAEKPNIVMVQLESFFDANYIEGLAYERNPVPFFESLKKIGSTGFLTVPSVGAGTANTEFEVLSGMSLDYFGMGEYPYKTILQQSACETICTDLREQGYSTHAIHNNTGTFYDRNVVYANMGFDTFTSVEYMQNVEYNPIGWSKDACLTGEILKALDSTENEDFVFTVTVQGHGKYQRGAAADYAGIGVDGVENEELRAAYEYYLGQLSETDDFIGELVAALGEYDEPVVLVLYGDHLPNFDYDSEKLKNDNVFQTEYVIWSNFPMKKHDEDISAYQLASLTLERTGADGGLFSDFHREFSGNEDYERLLHLLEYDVLYGEYYAYGGENPYVAADMQMGVSPINVNRVKWRGGELYVYGEGFTEWSVISVDGDSIETVLIGDSVLHAYIDEPENGAEIRVEQCARDRSVLSSSNAYRF